MDAVKRIAVVDLGTNSTRLLIADVADGRVDELERRTEVTRLGEGVDSAGKLDAGRDGAGVRDGRVVPRADRRARARQRWSASRRAPCATRRTARSSARSWRTASASRRGRSPATRRRGSPSSARRAGARRAATRCSCSTSAAAARSSWSASRGPIRPSTSRRQPGRCARPSATSPTTRRPTTQLSAVAGEVAAIIEAEVPREVRRNAATGIAVAGTATSLAAVDQRLEEYDPERVHGYRLDRYAVEEILAHLAEIPLAERREIVGLPPGRAPTIVAGAIILSEAMRAFDFDWIETSEADILHGAALDAARRARRAPTRQRQLAECSIGTGLRRRYFRRAGSGETCYLASLESARYIGSGEAASYRRLPPSEPLGPFMARTPARPDGANLNRLPRGGGSRSRLGQVATCAGRRPSGPSARSRAPACPTRTRARAPASARRAS